MDELAPCCGVQPKASYDTKTKKWVICCPVCHLATNGHSSRKKAVIAWQKKKGGVLIA